jgi:hypothetical protein
MARYAPLTYDSALVGRAPAKPAKPNALRRFYDAIIEARLHQAERELARYRALRPATFGAIGGRAPSGADRAPISHALDRLLANPTAK